MSMPLPASVLLLGAGMLLIAAAVSDLRRFVIPNWIGLALVALYVVRCAAFGVSGAPLAPMALPLALASSTLLVGAGLFYHGWLGGGDVKLLTAATLWIPPERFVSFLALTALLGGVLAVVVAAATLVRRPALADRPTARHVAALRLPYGVAISGAGLLFLFTNLPA